jgi:uncharacterized membrane protein
VLFLTNLTAIAFASAVVFAALGFRPAEAKMTARERAKVTERSILASGALVMLMGILLVTETIERVRDERRDQLIEQVIPDYLGSIGVGTSVWRWQLDEPRRRGPLELTVVLNATRQLSGAENDGLRSRLSTELESPLNLYISVLPTAIVRQKQAATGP